MAQGENNDRFVAVADVANHAVVAHAITSQFLQLTAQGLSELARIVCWLDPFVQITNDGWLGLTVQFSDLPLCGL